MRSVLIAAAVTLALAGPAAAATDLVSANVEFRISNVDPAVDGAHGLIVRLWTDEAGAPQATILVDGDEITALVPPGAPDAGLPPLHAPGVDVPPAAPGLPEIPTLP